MANGVGLKLHLGLSQFLGSMGKLWLSCSTSAYRFIDRPVMASLLGMLPLHSVQPLNSVYSKPELPSTRQSTTSLLSAGLLAAAGVTDGLTMQLALVCSLLHILALPVLIAYVLYTKLYGLQLRCTLLMWRLMRGNRYVGTHKARAESLGSCCMPMIDHRVCIMPIVNRKRVSVFLQRCSCCVAEAVWP